MIKISNPIPEPLDFDKLCRTKGTAWLIKNTNKARPLAYWSPFKKFLADGFKGRCGYSAMWISSGTVDHFVSCNEDMNLAYEWENYRYIEGWINSSKNKKSSKKILDPFVVKAGWFEVDLPSLQLKITSKVPKRYLRRAQYTLDNLPLKHDERIIRQRRAWLEMYEKGTPLSIISEKAPLIADAIVKHNWPRKP